MASTRQAKASKGKSPGLGLSDGASQRRERNRTGKLHTGKPGSTFRIGATVYAVAKDGSLRRGRELCK